MIANVARALGSLAVVLLVACGSRGEPVGAHAPATIVDLSTSVAELQRDFDAHADEPRFVMLLAPS